MGKKLRLNLNSRIADHLIQAVLIFTSVFLAFWLTDRRDNKNKDQKLEVSLKQIALEMKYNHDHLVEAYLYHADILNQIDSLQQEENGRLDEYYGYDLDGWEGMVLPLLRSSAYNTYLISGISDHADYQITKSLADIYNGQSIIERLDDNFLNIAINDQGFTRLDKVQHYSSLYYETIPDLLGFYRMLGEKWLQEYEYSSHIEDATLSDKVDRRIERLKEDVR